MKSPFLSLALSAGVFLATAANADDGDGSVALSGELRQWHKVTLTLAGPFAKETDSAPNPFTDYRFDVVFTHESGLPQLVVPGYFAADGKAAESSASEGNQWRAHLAPEKTGTWNWETRFRQGKQVALSTESDAGEALAPFDGKTGSFEIQASDKTGRDFRAHGRLGYVGKHHLQFAGTKEFFLKAGPDAPETLLAYADFDGTVANNPKKCPLKTWEPHIRDWSEGDPSWQDGKGKGLIGALNYLAGKGLNSFSFLPYNAGGDGDNVWPFVERNAKFHYDCSKLDQWEIVFDHATANGLYLHFKLQETEIDDNRRGHKEAKTQDVPTSLDGDKLGPERKLYCRELVARFGHHLALNWNIGEENTQSPEEVRAMARYLRAIDPYDHHLVIHTFPDQQDKVYPPLLGDGSDLTGASLQNPWNQVHERTLKWIDASVKAGKPWVVANDEQNPAGLGVPPDPGYQGHDGVAREARKNGNRYTLDDIRKQTLWGNLMAGGAGVEYYFGYQLPENDLACEDFRSRDRSWDFCRIALEFFAKENVPFQEMSNANELVGNGKNDATRWCLAKAGEVYLVYLLKGGASELDLSEAEGEFSVQWFDPRTGGDLKSGSVSRVRGGEKVSLEETPDAAQEDWLVVIRK